MPSTAVMCCCSSVKGVDGAGVDAGGVDGPATAFVEVEAADAVAVAP